MEVSSSNMDNVVSKIWVKMFVFYFALVFAFYLIPLPIDLSGLTKDSMALYEQFYSSYKFYPLVGLFFVATALYISKSKSFNKNTYLAYLMAIAMAVVAFSIFFLLSSFYGVLKIEVIGYGFMIAIWGVLSFRLIQKQYRFLQNITI